MLRRANCTACTFMKNGVKTRKNIPHTCGKSDCNFRELIEKVNEGYAKGTISNEKVQQISDMLGDAINKTDDLINKTNELIDEIRRNKEDRKTRK